MADEVPAAGAHETTDTGPLRWDAEKRSNARLVATVVLAGAMLAIAAMLVHYASAGFP